MLHGLAHEADAFLLAAHIPLTISRCAVAVVTALAVWQGHLFRLLQLRKWVHWHDGSFVLRVAQLLVMGGAAPREVFVRRLTHPS
eukprot:6206961-Pleurochrysis_carterae.AAC.4